MLLSNRHRAGKRKKCREEAIPRLAALHFPLGGHRFRPCLEEILYNIIEEYGIDTVDSHWRNPLHEGIRGWRLKQLRTAIHDEPDVAREALADYDARAKGAETNPGPRRSGLDRL